MLNRSLVSALARCFLAGEMTVEAITLRCTQLLGFRPSWIASLALRFVESSAGKTRPRHREVVRLLLQDPGFQKATPKRRPQPSLIEPQQMQPVAAASTWNLPVIASVGDLADWLWLDTSELEWFADLKELADRSGDLRLQHYNYRFSTKRNGSVRLLESPKRRLKRIQREILSGILDKIPTNPAAHGFVKERSIKTFVAPHVGQPVLLRMDLREFFPSIAGARVQTFFRTIGYPEAVADLLGGLCTNAAPRRIWTGPAHEAVQMEGIPALYAKPHLPQGAPTSPSLANLCAYRVDCRLSGLAGAAGAKYTRYADDLAFSGDEAFGRGIERFIAQAAAILLEEGFSVQHRKTRVMRKSVQQRLTGLVINERLSVSRADFDRLKATLTNCVRLGTESQNRDRHLAFRLHLEGRVGFVESIHPEKGGRLRRILERIEWP